MPSLPSQTGRDEPGWQHMAVIVRYTEKWPVLPVWLLHQGNIPSPPLPTLRLDPQQADPHSTFTDPPRQHTKSSLGLLTLTPPLRTRPSECWAGCLPCSGRACTGPSGWGAGGLTVLGALSCAPPQAVLQQLVGASGAGSCHQAHGGFMQEHLGRHRGNTVRPWVFSSRYPSMYRVPFPAAPHLPPDDTPSLHTTLPCSALEATSVVLTLTRHKPEMWRSGRNKEHSTGQLAGGNSGTMREKRQRAASDEDSAAMPSGLRRQVSGVKPQVLGGCFHVENRTE